MHMRAAMFQRILAGRSFLHNWFNNACIPLIHIGLYMHEHARKIEKDRISSRPRREIELIPKDVQVLFRENFSEERELEILACLFVFSVSLSVRVQTYVRSAHACM